MRQMGKPTIVWSCAIGVVLACALGMLGFYGVGAAPETTG